LLVITPTKAEKADSLNRQCDRICTHSVGWW